jgi:hypothetical protein
MMILMTVENRIDFPLCVFVPLWFKSFNHEGTKNSRSARD